MNPNTLHPSALARWQATALCTGLVLLVVPLIGVPVVIAGRLAAHLPVATDVIAATVGIALSLATFLALGPLLAVPLGAVFVRRPNRTAVLWIGFGCLLVAAIVTAALVVSRGTIASAGGAPIDRVQILLLAAVLAAWPAVLEEFLVRGYLLGVVGRRWNWPVAIAGTSALFALLHHGHATGTWSLLLHLGTTATAGVLFGLVTLSTRNVWNAVAIHAAWNTLFSTDVLQFRTPGAPADVALLTIDLATDPWAAGGGVVDVPRSPIAIAVLLAGVGAVLWIDRRRAA